MVCVTDQAQNLGEVIQIQGSDTNLLRHIKTITKFIIYLENISRIEGLMCVDFMNLKYVYI